MDRSGEAIAFMGMKHAFALVLNHCDNDSLMNEFGEIVTKNGG